MLKRQAISRELTSPRLTRKKVGRYTAGLHIGHDRGAAIVCDGELIGHLPQERLDRKKHSAGSKLPLEALDCLLSYLRLDVSQMAAIGLTFENMNIALFADDFAEELRFHYGVSSLNVIGVPHHLAHAMGAYITSGFDEALVLVADGAGDLIDGSFEAETLFAVSKRGVDVLERRLQTFLPDTYETPHFYNARMMPDEYKNQSISIGRKYEQFTHLIGFGREQHGKTMGLASYGEPLFPIPRLEPSGVNFDLNAIDLLDNLEGIRARRGVSTREFLQAERANVARTIQDFTEGALVELVQEVIGKYPGRRLCLSGGVFLNCVANHKIRGVVGNQDIHILPACGDDGQAIGAAAEAYRVTGGALVRLSKAFPYLGISYDSSAITAAVRSFGLASRQMSTANLASFLAERLSDGATIGILRGRTEIGPRALGHRSILIDPRRPDGKDFLNRHVKFREAFRPYAPIVTVEDQFEYFDLATSSPYMLYACQVRPKYQGVLPAVTHVDGTARVQSVSRQSEPFLHLLLNEFKKRTEFPILLNTSFNLNGDPIVETPHDAIRTFLNTSIDILVLESQVIEKPQQGAGMQ
jgi:carbamoyltransferase